MKTVIMMIFSALRTNISHSLDSLPVWESPKGGREMGLSQRVTEQQKRSKSISKVLRACNSCRTYELLSRVQTARPHGKNLPTTRKKWAELGKRQKATELFETLLECKHLPRKDTTGSREVIYNFFWFLFSFTHFEFSSYFSITKANELNLWSNKNCLWVSMPFHSL